MKPLFRFALLTSSLLVGRSAWGSADTSCYPEWKLKQTDLTGCSSSALMGPGNDTRVNLLMLLFDRHGATGISTVPNYDYGVERRGDAQPFDYPLFAEKLGGSQRRSEGMPDDTPWGTRCISNASGMAAFKAALSKSRNVSSSDAAKLTAARQALNPQCGDGDAMVPAMTQAVAGVSSDGGRPFAAYLLGAAAFYDGNYAGARHAFGMLGKAKEPWVAEASSYMLGRAALNEAMLRAFDEYGGLSTDGTDKQMLASAEAGFAAYLKAYPNGQYAPSARGLMRKLYWLGRDTKKLMALYVAAFDAKPVPGAGSLADLVQEFDIKLLSSYDFGGQPLGPAGVSDALTLAVVDLRAMRQVDTSYGNTQLPVISRAELDRQKPRFAGNDALYNYVLAAHSYYVANKPVEVLKLIPEERTSGSYLSFSRQLLRALALDATGDAKARGALVVLTGMAKHPFQRGAVELALAMHDERHGGIDNVFAGNSLIGDPDIREILLRYHAGPALLRKQAVNKSAAQQERAVATYTLLYKQLTRGLYKDFLGDLSLVPPGTKPPAADDYYTPGYTNLSIFTGKIDSPFGCAPVKGVATSLMNNPKDAAAQLCLADFVRVNGLDPDFYSVAHDLDELPPKDQLGGTASLFPGKPFSRLEIYKTLIADPAVSASNKSYALYRAINCYGPSGNNGCGGTEVPQATRKAWYNRLKKEFATTTWAKQQKYYW